MDLVGAGPGDPGLLTRLGAEALSMAEVVVHDHLVHPSLLDLAPASSERIFAGKQAGKCALRQPEINDLLASLAKAGKRVVRLKGGDPFVFGRGGEEAEHLAAQGIPFRVIPGVTAALGASAFAGIPLTHRGEASAVAFVTGHDGAPLDWPALARFPGTLVVYMGVGRVREIGTALIDAGKPAGTPAAMIQSATMPTQRTVTATLGEIADAVRDANLGPPGLLIVGDVVARRPMLDWFESRPLFGRSVVVTRPEADAARSAAMLEALGAEVLLAPTVEIRALEDFAKVDHAIANMNRYDWLVFTSANGVRHFFDRLSALGRDARALGSAKIASIGPATSEALRSYRLVPDLQPPEHRSEALSSALIEHVRGRRVLLARADRGRDVLVEALREVADIELLTVYRNVDAESLPAEVVARIAGGTVDWITLTSPAIARRLHDLLPEAARREVGSRTRLASLSPLTSEAARENGWQVAAEAAEITWGGLIAAILKGESPSTA